jgi:hypothetical protein
MEAPPEDACKPRRPDTRSSRSWLTASLFGAVVLPVVILVGWLWLDQDSECLGIECVGTMVCQAGALGLGFGYLAGLAWGWPEGLAGPAFGVLLGLVLVALTEGFAGPGELGAVAVAGAVALALPWASVVGFVAYPVGVLGRWVLVRAPPLGFAWGGVLFALGISGIFARPAVDLRTVFAPAMLVAGAGTLAVSSRLAVRGSPRPRPSPRPVPLPAPSKRRYHPRLYRSGVGRLGPPPGARLGRGRPLPRKGKR